ncbi:FAR-17a/AIG1-like protein [Ordospora pajunii]|uniref:FAR-17a/AIG1-like protein n=1 Tax=Ordospora pajunii TaxID=3039483 RepID=UPI00295260EF|nr:FAR-17a/AIG1-like protein [Ordospora pajunii]KAH9411755.1 FAR-17a/AIG1-like protein [Ordospora pajunii]
MVSKRYFQMLTEILKGVLLLLCVYGASDYSQTKESIDLSNRIAGGNHVYLTYISLYMTIITLFLSYLVKHFGFSSINGIYRDALAITLPIEALVTSVFWTLNSIDPTLLKDRDLYLAGIRTPFISELSIHLVPMILLLADQFGAEIKHKNHHYHALIIIPLAYLFVIHYVYWANNYWIYPFLGCIPAVMRIGLTLVLIVLILIYYNIFQAISKLLIKGIPEHSKHSLPHTQYSEDSKNK